MDEREQLIKRLIKEKKGSREDYLNLLNSIAYHESGHTMSPTIKQIGGGPGRGKYQFEVGKNAGGITAARRTLQYYKENNIPVPEWLKKATSYDDLDVTTLSSEQQDILFLGNMRKHPKANFSNIWEGKETIQDFWANYHWAGSDKDRKTRLKSFNSSYNKYKDNSINTYTSKRKVITDEREEAAVKIDNTNVDRNEFKPTPLFEFAKKNGLKNTPSSQSQNVAAYGGNIGFSSYDKGLNEFNGGGTHEQNPLGGIPLGVGSNGQQNTVEEEETSVKLKRGNYIFSNRLKL